MKKLTDKQIISITNLVETYNAISATSLANHGSFSSVDIHAKDDLNADEWDSIKVAVESIFPGSRIGRTSNFQDYDGDHSNYHFNNVSEVLITLYTNKKLPAPTESQEKITLDDLTMFDAVEEERELQCSTTS